MVRPLPRVGDPRESVAPKKILELCDLPLRAGYG